MKYHLCQDSLWKVVETAKTSDSKDCRKISFGHHCSLMMLIFPDIFHSRESGIPGNSFSFPGIPGNQVFLHLAPLIRAIFYIYPHKNRLQITLRPFFYPFLFNVHNIAEDNSLESTNLINSFCLHF